MAALPLEGIRVLDVGDVWAGPYACTLLADWGAEVIKVESIQRFTTRGQLNPPPKRPERTNPALWGYPDEIPGPRPWNRAPVFNNMNRNKQGITLDLRSEAGVALYKKLVQVSDVVIENYAYNVMVRLGVGYEALRQVNPELIMFSMPLFGNTGPNKHWKGWGSSAEPMAGHVSLRGYPDQDVKALQGIVHTDAVSSFTTVFAALSALRHRQRTGKGQFIDFGQCEAFMPHLGEYFMDYAMNGRVAGRIGNRHPQWAPHGCYPALPDPNGPEGRADRWITIVCSSDEEWQALRGVMGNPAWSQDPKFADMPSRKRHEDELDQHLAAWTQGQDHYALFHQLQAAGVPAGPVLDHGEVYADPHVEARGFLQEVTHPEAGTHRYPSVAWKMSKSEGRIRNPANTLGEHNYKVLTELLGLCEADLAQLEAAQVIGNAFLPGSDQ
ncbi:MAG: CoA transferase [Chloroflexi bacterium]|nr:CoA transferase [Chloroflexota bacterium]